MIWSFANPSMIGLDRVLGVENSIGVIFIFYVCTIEAAVQKKCPSEALSLGRGSGLYADADQVLRVDHKPSRYYDDIGTAPFSVANLQHFRLKFSLASEYGRISKGTDKRLAEVRRFRISLIQNNEKEFQRNQFMLRSEITEKRRNLVFAVGILRRNLENYLQN